MGKELKFEDIANLKATKLFEDLGYKLVSDIMYYESTLLFKYESIADDLYQITCMYDKDNNFISVYNNRYYSTGGHAPINIIPLMYPIMKLLEELQIDIKQVYFYKTKGDNNE